MPDPTPGDIRETPAFLHPAVAFVRYFIGMNDASVLLKLFPKRQRMPLRGVDEEVRTLATVLKAAAELDDAYTNLARVLSQFESICLGIPKMVTNEIRAALSLYEHRRCPMPRIQNILLLDAHARGLSIAAITSAATSAGILRGGAAAKNLADRRTSSRREVERLGVPSELVDDWIAIASAYLHPDSRAAIFATDAKSDAKTDAKSNRHLNEPTRVEKTGAKKKAKTLSSTKRRSTRAPGARGQRLTRRDRDGSLEPSPPLRANGRTASP